MLCPVDDTRLPACRLDSLPLTLADLSGPCHIPACTLGRHYVALCRLLGLAPPLLLAPHLLPRCVERVAAQAVQGGVLTAAQVAALRRDAGAMLGWMSAQMARQAYPLAAVGAALVLAAEMNTVGAGAATCLRALPWCALAAVLAAGRTLQGQGRGFAHSRPAGPASLLSSGT